ncbi:MAG: LytR family transcriptional regulator [Calditrichaeota bacterium]|nr:MAG: LytR family transcriptional regulator [Calditrichota bacterium]
MSHLVKRTRRNLSDSRIRKIVNSQIGNGTRSSTKRTPKHSNNGQKSRSGVGVIIFLILIIGAGFFIYTRSQEINEFITHSFFSTSPKNTHEQSQPIATRNTLESEKQVTSPRSTDKSPDNIAPQAVIPPKPLQVEVLNGCGVSGLADRITRYLRQHGIDVVDKRNYKNFNVKQTQIIARRENTERLISIAEVLGIPVSRIKVQKKESLQLDATIILGADYQTLTPLQK